MRAPCFVCVAAALGGARLRGPRVVACAARMWAAGETARPLQHASVPPQLFIAAVMCICVRDSSGGAAAVTHM